MGINIGLTGSEPTAIITRLFTVDFQQLLQLYVPIYKVLEQPQEYFTSLKPCKCSQILQTLPRVASTPNRKRRTNNGLTIYKHSIHTRLYQLTCRRSTDLFPPLGLHKEILDTLHLLISLINARKKKIKKTLDPPSVLICFSLKTRNRQLSLSTRQIALARVTNSWTVAHSCLQLDQFVILNPLKFP